VEALPENQPDLAVRFQETAEVFDCPEEDTLTIVSVAPSGTVLLATLQTDVFGTSYPRGGILAIDPNGRVRGLVDLSNGFAASLPMDLAVSRRGDLFLARSQLLQEVMVIDETLLPRHFATLPSGSSVELDLFPRGLVAGCRSQGPFLLSCRDTLVEIPTARYPGGVNDDAFAVDPSNGSLYYIRTATAELLRLSVDSTGNYGTPTPVTTLSAIEARAARGMVCGSSGELYVLVDTTGAHRILRVDPTTGQQEVWLDFASVRPSPGVQRDLAIDRRLSFLYTLDTEANELLRIDLRTKQVVVFVAGSAVSLPGSSGERVGLFVVP
jgi:hypothetical protein